MGKKDKKEAPKYPRGKHPNSIAALARRKWKPGESGNPEGKQSVGPIVTPALRRFAYMTPAEFFRLDLQHMTLAEVIAAGYMTEAMQSGFERGRAEVLDRLDGKVKEVKEVTGADGGPIELVWSDGSEA